MATATTQTIYVEAEDKPIREGTLNYTEFNSGDRMGRALKVLGFCWLMAGITLFIPLAHFVLVPGFFIAGPVLVFMRYKVERANDNVDVRCPICDQDVTVNLEPNDQLPLYTYCPNCNKSIRVTE